MVPIEKITTLPHRLQEIADPPKELFIQGDFPNQELKFLTVVGSRNHSAYGKAVCEKLIQKLAGYPIVIVSGMALGIDTVAHEAALRAGLLTVAIPGSGLDSAVLYPKSNFSLSRKILEAGGCLVSEFSPNFKATKWSFIQRNRIGAGLADAVLLIEAGEKSGTLTTARFAIDYNREVLVIPGNITSPTSQGTNALLKDGATPVLTSSDILYALGITPREEEEKQEKKFTSPLEKHIWDLLREPKTKEELATLLPEPLHEINITLSLMEIRGDIRQVDGLIHQE